MSPRRCTLSMDVFVIEFSPSADLDSGQLSTPPWTYYLSRVLVICTGVCLQFLRFTIFLLVLNNDFRSCKRLMSAYQFQQGTVSTEFQQGHPLF